MIAYPFIENPQAPFKFSATLDGADYQVSVPWNSFALGYYLRITNARGVQVLNTPVVGSPDGFDISMTAGLFATKIVFRASTNQFEVI